MLLSDIKTQIKELCEIEGITLKELANRAGMNYTGLHDKFRRQSITVGDLMKLLDCLGYSLAIVKNKDKNIEDR